MDDIDLDELFGEGENTLFDGMDDGFDLNEIGDEIMGAIDSGTGSQFDIEATTSVADEGSSSKTEIPTTMTETIETDISATQIEVSTSTTTTKKSKRNKSSKSKKSRIKEDKETVSTGKGSGTIEDDVNNKSSSRKSKRRTRSSSAKDTTAADEHEIDAYLAEPSSSSFTAAAAEALPLHSEIGGETTQKPTAISSSREQKKKRRKKNKHKYDESHTTTEKDTSTHSNASLSLASGGVMKDGSSSIASGEPPPKKKIKSSSISTSEHLLADASSSSAIPSINNNNNSSSSNTSPPTLTKTKSKTKKNKRRSSASIDVSLSAHPKDSGATGTSDYTTTERQISSTTSLNVADSTVPATSLQKSNLHELFDRQLKQQQLKTAPIASQHHPPSSSQLQQHHSMPPESAIPVQQLSNSNKSDNVAAGTTSTTSSGGVAVASSSSSALQEGTPLEPSQSLFYPFCVLPNDIHYGARKQTRTFPLLDQVHCSLIPGVHHKREHDSSSNNNSTSNSNGHASSNNNAAADNSNNRTTSSAGSETQHNIDDAKSTLGKLNINQVTNELRDAYDILMRQRAFLAQSNANMQHWCQTHFKQFDYDEIFGKSNDPDGKVGIAMAETFRSQAYGQMVRLRRSSNPEAAVRSSSSATENDSAKSVGAEAATTTITKSNDNVGSSHFVPSKLGRTQLLKQWKMSSLRKLITGQPPRTYTVKVKCVGFKPPFEIHPITQKKQKRTISAIIHIPSSSYYPEEEAVVVEEFHPMATATTNEASTIYRADVAASTATSSSKNTDNTPRSNEPVESGNLAMVPKLSQTSTDSVKFMSENKNNEMNMIGTAAVKENVLVPPLMYDQSMSSTNHATTTPLISPSTVYSTATTATTVTTRMDNDNSTVGIVPETTTTVVNKTQEKSHIEKKQQGHIMVSKEDRRQKRRRQRIEDDKRDWLADYKTNLQRLEKQISKQRQQHQQQQQRSVQGGDGTSTLDHDITTVVKSVKKRSHYRVLPYHYDDSDTTSSNNQETQLLWRILKEQYLVLDTFGGDFTYDDDDDEDDNSNFKKNTSDQQAFSNDDASRLRRKEQHATKILERKRMAINFALSGISMKEFPYNPLFDIATTTLSSLLSEHNYLTDSVYNRMAENASTKLNAVDMKNSKSSEGNDMKASTTASSHAKDETIHNERKNGKTTFNDIVDDVKNSSKSYYDHDGHNSLAYVNNTELIQKDEFSKSCTAKHLLHDKPKVSDIKDIDEKIPNLFDRLTSLLVDIDDDDDDASSLSNDDTSRANHTSSHHNSNESDDHNNESCKTNVNGEANDDEGKRMTSDIESSNMKVDHSRGMDVSQLSLNERMLVQLQAFNLLGPEILERVHEDSSPNTSRPPDNHHLEVNDGEGSYHYPTSDYKHDRINGQDALSPLLHMKKGTKTRLSSSDHFRPHSSAHQIEILKQQHNNIQRSIGQTLSILRSEAFRHIDWLYSDEAKKIEMEEQLLSKVEEKNNTELELSHSLPPSLADQWRQQQQQQQHRPMIVQSHSFVSNSHVKSHHNQTHMNGPFLGGSIERGRATAENRHKVHSKPRLVL